MTKLHKISAQGTPEETIIQALVQRHNARKKKYQFGGNYEPESDCENDAELSKCGFDTKLYVCHRRGQIPPILKWHGSPRKTGPIHLVWFFYRPRKIFAFTTNQGFRLVHDYSEFHFPNKIAARLCTDAGFKEVDQRLLVGPCWEESRLSKANERASLSDLPSLYSSFTSELRHDASIMAVTDLSNSSHDVECKACSVRFVSSLSIIARGEDTFKYFPPTDAP